MAASAVLTPTPVVRIVAQPMRVVRTAPAPTRVLSVALQGRPGRDATNADTDTDYLFAYRLAQL